MDNDDISKMTPAEQEVRMMEAFYKMAPEDQEAFAQIIEWMAQRPDKDVPMTHERMDQLMREVKLENKRRRAGGKLGVVLEFKRPEKP